MLDLVELVGPTDDGLSIVSLADIKKHLGISYSKAATDAVLEEAVKDAAATLHADLNRTIFPTTWKRYLNKWPSGPIPLPYPPLLEVISINIEDGESPPTAVDSSLYVVRDGMLVPEIALKSGKHWPSVNEGPRAISVTFRAGYEEYPALIKRFVKFLAGHYFENREATIVDPRMSSVSRSVQFGIADLRAKLRIPVDYSDWGE